MTFDEQIMADLDAQFIEYFEQLSEEFLGDVDNWQPKGIIVDERY